MRGQGHWADMVPDEHLGRSDAKRLLARLWKMLRPHYATITFTAVLLVVQEIGRAHV